MIHAATARFWVLYEALPKDVREIADGVQWFWIGSHADYDKIVG